MADIRIPTQKRSIEKRNKIIQKGFELMCKNGYHKTNTSDIAEYAGVSTGIIYQYFNDKKEILIEGIKMYSDTIMFPLLNILDKEQVKIDNMEDMLNRLIDEFIKVHTVSKKSHEEMMAMSHLDDDIAEIFHEREIMLTNKIINLLEYNGIKRNNMREKVHIISGLVENLCHEIVYHKHSCINYDAMKEETIQIIINILKEK